MEMADFAERAERQVRFQSAHDDSDLWQQRAAMLNQSLPVAVGKETEVPNLDEPARQHMEKESADKLDCVE